MRAATIRRTASAPAARASQTCQGSRTKSLRSTGSAVARRTSSRCAIRPPKNGSSVRTEIAAAPAASYPRATSAGARSSRIVPREGERRLCSAITFSRPGRAIAAANGRTGGAWRTAGCESAERPPLLLRRHALARPREDGVEDGAAVAHARASLTRSSRRRARPSSIAAAACAHAVAQVLRPARDQERGGGVEQHDVALRPRRAARARRARSPRSPAGRPRAARRAEPLARPASSGVTVNVRTSPSSSSATVGGTGEGQLVEAAAVHDPGPLRPEPLQAARDEGRELGLRHADHLAFRAGRGS